MQKYLTYRCSRNEEAKRSKHGNILNDNPVNDQPVIYFGPGLSYHTNESILNRVSILRIQHYFREMSELIIECPIRRQRTAS